MEAHSPRRRKELCIIIGDSIAEEVNQEGGYFFENDEREPATADTNEVCERPQSCQSQLFVDCEVLDLPFATSQRLANMLSPKSNGSNENSKFLRSTSSTGGASSEIPGHTSPDASTLRNTVPSTPLTRMVEELTKIQQEFLLIEQDIDFEGSEVIGAGAGGDVIKAKLKSSQQVVAVKVLHVEPPESDGNYYTSDLSLDKGLVLDLLQEIRVGTSLARHVNVGTFIGACVHRNFPWVVLEYIDGPNLLQYLESQKQINSSTWHPPRNMSFQWAEQLFSALEHLHSNSPPMIHRDVKPANIMLTQDLTTLKLVDFGLCKVMRSRQRLSQSTRNTELERPASSSFARGDRFELSSANSKRDSLSSEGETSFDKSPQSPCRPMSGKCGTWRYMAPEVYESQGVYTAKVDVYSATLVVFYMITGELPFSGIQQTEVIGMLVSRQGLRPVLSNKIFKKVPELAAVLQKGWAQLDSDRATALEMRAMLQPIVAQHKKKANTFFGKLKNHFTRSTPNLKLEAVAPVSITSAGPPGWSSSRRLSESALLNSTHPPVWPPSRRSSEAASSSQL